MPEARYDAIADFYAAEFGEIDDPASAALLDLLGPPAGLRVLDVACGHGRITRELARRGAEVVGIDISARLIARAIAAERDQPLGIRYIHADVTAGPADLGAVMFDAVTCNFGLSDIDNLDAAAAAVSGALKPAGRFVFAILHPCFPGAADVASSWPATRSYYDEGLWTADAELSQLRRQVGSNHRMLSTYLNTLRRHDLWLDHVREPAPTAQWSQHRPRAGRAPVFLAASCLKSARTPAD
jgi:SAM-dependent methyltransferase